MNWLYVVVAASMSSWLAYINWRVRMKEDSGIELNPIWAMFDEAGFKKIQFFLIPLFYTGIIFYLFYSGNDVLGGFYVGILYLNTLFDVMSFNKILIAKDTNLDSTNSNSKRKVMKTAFSSAMIRVFTFTILVALIPSIALTVLQSFYMSNYVLFVLSVFTLIITMIIIKYIDIDRKLLFRDYQEPARGRGLPYKREGRVEYK